MSNNNHTTEYLFGSDSNDSDSTYDLILSAKITVARNSAKKMITRSKSKRTPKTLSVAKRYSLSIKTKTYSSINKRGKEMKIEETKEKRYNLRNISIEKSMTNNAVSKRNKKS